MLTSQHYNALGQPMADSGELGGPFDFLTNAVGSVMGAIKGVANTACGAASTFGPMISAVAGPQGGSIVSKAQGYCSTYNTMVNPPVPTGAGVPPPAQAQAPFSPQLMQIVRPLSKYPAGSIARYNATRNVFSIYAPMAHAGFGNACGVGELGADAVTPAVPAGMVKVGEEAGAPAGVPQAGTEKDAGFFSVKNPWFWASAAGAVAVVGSGSYFLFRKRG